MRKLILVAGAAVAVSGCGNDQTSENNVNRDVAAAAEEITSNDTTAIDAATGDDANMAADVNYMIEEEANGGGNADDDARDTDRSAPRASASAPAREAARAPASEPAPETGNAAENAE